MIKVNKFSVVSLVERKQHMTKTEIRVEETGNPKEKQQIELQQVLVWVTCTSA